MFLATASWRPLLLVSVLLAGLPLEVPAAESQPATAQTVPPRSRTFLFTYSATVTGLPAGKETRIWLPVPPSNEDQEVQLVSKELPGNSQSTRETTHGNPLLYVEAQANADGQVPLTVTYRVTRREVKGDFSRLRDDRDVLARFLQPDARVPIQGKPLELLQGKQLPRDQVATARVLYDIVNKHMRYSKEGTGWGQGDAVWACQSGSGNCSDFHSLFISLARSQKIPAQFEIGFPLPPQRGAGAVPGYHCWAKFRPSGKDWIPVDISEANKNPLLRDYYFGNLTEDRVTFSVGRDLVLAPKQDGAPVNFLVYPYVEVDGQPYPADKVPGRFAYQDVENGK